MSSRAVILNLRGLWPQSPAMRSEQIIRGMPHAAILRRPQDAISPYPCPCHCFTIASRDRFCRSFTRLYLPQLHCLFTIAQPLLSDVFQAFSLFILMAITGIIPTCARPSSVFE